MADSGGVRAGKAFVEIYAKDGVAGVLKETENRMKRFGDTVSGLGSKVGLAGTAVSAGLIALVKKSAESGAAIFDMSKRTGIAVENLSAMSYAADQTGTDIGTLEGAIKRMQKSVAGVADEAEGTSGKLDQLGISAEQIVGLNPAEQFKIIANAIKQIPDPTQRAAAAMSVFGRAGTSLLPLIDRFGELTAEAKKLGFVRTSEAAAQAKALDDELKRGVLAAKGMAGAIGSALIPALKEKTVYVEKLTLRMRDWLREHKPLIAEIGGMAIKLGTMAVAVGGVLVVFGKLVGISAGVIGAIRGIGAGLVFLATNPLVAVAGSIAVVVGGLFALSQALNFAATIKKINPFDEQIESLRSSRPEIKGYVERLQQLASQQRLTSDEQREAANIIENLKSRYGDLGVVLDRATGTILNLAAALVKLRTVEASREIATLTERIKENQKILDVYLSQVRGLGAAGDAPFTGLSEFFTGGTSDAIRQRGQQIADLQKQIREDTIRLKELNGGIDPFAGVTSPQGDKAAIEAARNAAALEKEKDVREKLTKAQQAAHQSTQGSEARAIEDVNAKLREQLQLIDELANIARIKGDKGELAKQQQARLDALRNAQEQLKRLRDQQADSQAGAIKSELDNRLSAIDSKQDAARDRGDAAEVQRLERQRVAVIAAAEAQIQKLRKQSLDRQVDDAKQAEAAQVALIDTLAEAAKQRNDFGEFNRLQRERVAAVQDAEQRITDLKRQALAQQQADAAKFQDEERRRRQERINAERDAHTLLLDLQRQLAEARGDKEGARKIANQQQRESLERELERMFGNNDALKKQYRDLLAKIQAAGNLASGGTPARGIFDPSKGNLQSLLGGGSTLERIAKSSEQSAKANDRTAANTKKLADKDAQWN